MTAGAEGRRDAKRCAVGPGYAAATRADKPRSTFERLRSGCAHYGVSDVRAMISLGRLYALDRFSLKEIFGYGLYVPAIRENLPLLISKERSLAKLARINSPRDAILTENKARFHEVGLAADLPVPRSYGVFRQGQGTDDAGRPLEGKPAWAAYFDARLPEHFIVKDMAGANASGFVVFERSGDGFRPAGGGPIDAAALYEFLYRRSAAGLVVQERLLSHPDLVTLSGCTPLQTMRVNTIMDGADRVSLLFYMIKILVQGNLADNFSMGTTGNLIAFGKADDGVLEGARQLHPCGSGLVTVHAHPETGTPFARQRIPGWDEAVELAKRAHRAFAAFGSLGWDIAITPRGVTLLEANCWWDPPTYAPHIMSDENWRRVFG